MALNQKLSAAVRRDQARRSLAADSEDGFIRVVHREDVHIAPLQVAGLVEVDRAQLVGKLSFVGKVLATDSRQLDDRVEATTSKAASRLPEEENLLL